ncbi:unnamed protein product [Peniophora sp. CBMAI 1063]|nr:unnamed protein product [Peniophora sp. CBMAI 1063]
MRVHALRKATEHVGGFDNGAERVVCALHPASRSVFKGVNLSGSRIELAFFQLGAGSRLLSLSIRASFPLKLCAVPFSAVRRDRPFVNHGHADCDREQLDKLCVFCPTDTPFALLLLRLQDGVTSTTQPSYPPHDRTCILSATGKEGLHSKSSLTSDGPCNGSSHKKKHYSVLKDLSVGARVLSQVRSSSESLP